LSSVGVTGSQFKRVEDERDLSGRVVLYTPPITVAPSDDDFYRQYCEYLLPLAQLSQGRVLCLFSSYRALSAAAEALKAKQLVDQSTIVLLIQSEKSTRSQAGQDNYRLVEQFKQQSSVILLGVGSFWEGLDLSGIPIAAVVIDKLPFAKPEDPLVSMRAAELAHFGVDSFEHYLLPEAIIRWRQGCGRLLRRASDRGVIMITDPRLQTKSYGAVFKNSLPPMPQLSDWQQVEEFIQNQSE
ncbi:MAG: ATP-dependent DNA helicase DinG, partial [Oceanicoccus sp.]